MKRLVKQQHMHTHTHTYTQAHTDTHAHTNTSTCTRTRIYKPPLLPHTHVFGQRCQSYLVICYFLRLFSRHDQYFIFYSIFFIFDIKLSCHQGRNAQPCVNSESIFRHWVCPKLAPVFHVKNHFCQISIQGIILFDFVFA